MSTYFVFVAISLTVFTELGSIGSTPVSGTSWQFKTYKQQSPHRAGFVVFIGLESLHLASQILEAAFELVQILALIADLALEAGQLAGA